MSTKRKAVIDFDFIVVAGAPGAGKTTVSKLVQAQEGWPRVELCHLRQFHLDRGWTNASPREEQMAFENLVAILKNYFCYGYRNVLVNDLEDFRVQQIPAVFADYRYVIVSLVLSDDAEHRRRVLNHTRDSGFRDYQRARQWNHEMQDRPLVPGEYRIDSAGLSPAETAAAVLNQLQELSR